MKFPTLEQLAQAREGLGDKTSDEAFASLESEEFKQPVKAQADHYNGAGRDEAAGFDVPDRRPFATAVEARRYMTAGKAVVTLVSVRTKARFTYRLTVSDDGQAIFVAVLNGPDNSSSYKYLGRIARDIFWEGRKVPRDGDISRDAPSMRAFSWAWRMMLRGSIPADLEVWHEGACGRCGRRLTVPESVASGFGPECSGRVA
jgi:hypothetical protein